MNQAVAKAALKYYLDHGVDEALSDDAQDRTLVQKIVKPLPQKAPARSSDLAPQQPKEPLLGKSDARNEAVKLAKDCKTLNALSEAIESFEGIAIRKTATNIVFCDGNPKASVMLVGEAPGADEDRQGKPFVGTSGQLLDRILKCIDLGRNEDDVKKAVYISNILNWRPPGNRTPNVAEIEVSLPFIERHIQLVSPKLLIFCGGVAAKSLLGIDESISRLRKRWYEYKPQTPELENAQPPIPAIATYHPAYLLRTPAQKKAVWADMLEIKTKLLDLK